MTDDDDDDDGGNAHSRDFFMSRLKAMGKLVFCLVSITDIIWSATMFQKPA